MQLLKADIQPFACHYALTLESW